MKITKETLKEFMDKYCIKCKAYFVCGGDSVICPDFIDFF